MDDVAALIELHEVQRRAHLIGDADLLATVFADEIRESSRGETSTLTRESMRDRFRSYFAAMRYLEWADVEPPFVRVVGSLAWMLVRVRARRVDLAGAPIPGFEASWIAIYEQTDGRWAMTGIASSVVEIA